MARTWPASSSPRSLRTIEARGGSRSRSNSRRSGMTRWTRAAWTRPMARMVRDKLAFERPQVIDVLDEARRREGVALVEDLVADAAARRNALAGEVHADARELRARSQDGLAVAAGLVGDAFRFELADDGARVLHREVRVENPHGGLRDPHDHEAEEQQRARASPPPIAASRAGPSLVKNSKAAFTALKPAPRDGYPARIARCMVSGGLTPRLRSTPKRRVHEKSAAGDGALMDDQGNPRTRTVTAGNAGCASCAVRRARADRSRAASSGILRSSACSAGTPLPG